MIHWREHNEGPGRRTFESILRAPRRVVPVLVARLVQKEAAACDHVRSGPHQACHCERVAHDIFEFVVNRTESVNVERDTLQCEADRISWQMRQRYQNVINAVHNERPNYSGFRERKTFWYWFSIFSFPERKNWDAVEIILYVQEFMADIVAAADTVGDKSTAELFQRVITLLEIALEAKKRGEDRQNEKS